MGTILRGSREKLKMFNEQAEDYDKLYYYDNSRARKEVAALIKFLKSRRPFKIKNILDVGCGTGLYAELLFKKGYKVTGLDISAKMLKIAEKRMAKYGGRLICADISGWNAPEAQNDAVLSLFLTLSYITSPDKFISALRNIHKSLKKGGLFLFDVVNGFWVRENFKPVYAAEIPGGVMIWERKLAVSKNVLIAKGTFYRNGRKSEDVQHFRFFTVPELEFLLKSVGFGSVKYYCGWNREKYSSKSPKLCVAAVK